MERKIDQEEFLLLHLTDDKRYPEICKEHQIENSTLSNWWKEGQELRKQIARSNSLFSSKKEKPEFAGFRQKGKRAFFSWYRKQPRVCHYCGIEEEKLSELFSNRILSTKRNRGASLELERKDAKGNLYSEENCVLACYFCNNHKSDIISEEDHRKYFAPQFRAYLEDKYAKIKKTALPQTEQETGFPSLQAGIPSEN